MPAGVRGALRQSRRFWRQRFVPFEERRVSIGTEGGDKAVSQRLRVSALRAGPSVSWSPLIGPARVRVRWPRYVVDHL